jgi:hypothetical protein
MLTEKIKSYLEIRVNKYFPVVRRPVLLIVIPALLIGTYKLILYCISYQRLAFKKNAVGRPLM